MISPLTKKKVKAKGSTVSDNLLLRNHSPSFENFCVQPRKIYIRIERSFLINKNIRTAPLYLFDRV